MISYIRKLVELRRKIFEEQNTNNKIISIKIQILMKNPETL